MEGERQLKASLGAPLLIFSSQLKGTSRVSELCVAFPLCTVWKIAFSCAQGGRGGHGLCEALFTSLCQFLRDSCSLRAHTSIMYSAGEGCLDRGHHVEIKEVIHPFYTPAG